MSSHPRIVFPLVLAVAVTAADTPSPGTTWTIPPAATVAWAAGPRTLVQAIALLGDPGRRPVLDAALDPSATRALPAFSGTWWHGVDAVSDAFGLVPVPGLGDASGMTMPGSSELTPDRSAPLLVPATAAPPVLATTLGPWRILFRGVHRRLAPPPMLMNGHWSIHADPGVPGAHPVRVAMSADRTATEENSGGGIPIADDQRPPLLVGATGSVGASLRIHSAWPWSARLVTGATQAIIADGWAPLTVHRDDLSLLVFGLPEWVQDGPWLELETMEIEDGPTGIRPVYDEPGQRFRIPPSIGEGAAIILRGTFRGTVIHLPVPAIEQDRMPTARETAPIVATTQMTWPAGRRTLTEAIALLDRGGERIRPVFTGNDRSTRNLPAFTGTWWQAVAAIADAWELSLGQVAQPGDPILLGPGRLDGVAAGPWFVQVAGITRTRLQSADGIDEVADVLCWIHPEPHRAATLGDPDLRWTNRYEDDVAHPLSEPYADGLELWPERHVAGRGSLLRIHHLPAQGGEIVVHGVIRAEPEEPVPVRAILERGTQGLLIASDARWLVGWYDAATLVRDLGCPDGDDRDALVMRRLDGNGRIRPDPRMQDAVGSPVTFDIHQDLDERSVFRWSGEITGPVTVAMPGPALSGRAVAWFTLSLTIPPAP
jgi:hypothetical protein